jgi:hypothetical protein
MSRVREWIWAHPGGARAAMAGTVAVAVAAGAFVVVRPDGDDAAGRQRHRQYAGSTETAGDQLGAPSDSTAPAVAGTDGSAPAGSPATGRGTGTTASGAPGTTGGTGTPGSAPGSADGSTTSTGGRGRSTSPQSGTGSTPSTGGRPAGTPATGTTKAPDWNLLPTAPIGARHGHAAVWTGREMVIWGGTSDFETDPFTDGAAYDPTSRTWRKLPPAPLTPRFDPWAYWTGQEMLLFGGSSVDGDFLTDGALWNPAANTWRSIPASPLGPRTGAVVGWAGDRLVVWSGNTVLADDAPDDAAAEVKNDGAAYVPATGTWVPVGAAPIPPRSGAQWAWTDSRLVISGGEGDDDDRTDGAAFDPVSGAWAPIANRPEPGSCGGSTACAGLWTGKAVLFPAASLAYDPAADRWTAMGAPPGSKAPAPGEPAVWTGQRLVAWGMPGDDEDASAAADATGDGPTPPVAALYDPVANRWQPFPAGPLGNRVYHTAVWTGEAMLIWGGMADDESPLGDGAAYRPE